LGGIYLDIVKDRLYTCKSDSTARRSCQTSLDYLLNILVRLIAPILSYTAEEIWQTSERLNHQEESVFLSNFDISEINNESTIKESDWKRIFEIKDAVNQSIEEMRNENKLKGSLDSVVNIFANSEDIKILEKLGNELHFLLISSEASIETNESFKININSSKNTKCTRCWHRHSSVGGNKEHPELCNRCIENIDNDGEQRKFV
jgi:isoleucyl-tRNA synthetase